MKLTLFNSLTRKKEKFTPIDTNLVKMYVCGPTVYDYPHIGNARSVVVYDILYRILIKIYGFKKVLYVRNITDIDDKIIAKASQDKISISELTNKTTQYFHQNMDYLSCLLPNIEPKATEHVQEMIEIISKLIEKDIAYKSNNHVYFDITKAVNYTNLSNRSLNDLLQNVRIENSSGKRNLGDFVLWKPSSDDDDDLTTFNSPFGLGRPGWHIECSAMSHKYLGETFDIHGGGIDLIFPHHTNEIAQSCSAFPNSEFAKIWVHNGFLTVNHEKMSKSLKNFITVEDLIKKGIHGQTVRLFLLSNHYRKPIDYNDKIIDDSYKLISYWYRAIEDIEKHELYTEDILHKDFMNALLEDLNTSNAIKIINDLAKKVHSSTNIVEKNKLARQMLSCARFLGLMNDSTKEWFQSVDNAEKIDKLISERIKAKHSKDWQRADSIRAELISMNIAIEDKNDGSTVWKKKN